ncbi:amino acid ABC transporter substrate-binding protein [Ancylobacter mangrovi]|uniref:Amino acid ABC transporter substrate-binding protein n=1 Tax=Ancylobacter mangrovi TaxID=2972472 RepID=A0A9X2PEL7_9HYPH|nr:amino acid ABC transporter substrate-binding protein [Ancylobacter mangrovi]MCS0495979.1 amino acid ABC transporter substrate-binding protein [Ancylobacter mangrovi]MCS0504603.1 amino acid ABC transporter substrate-binding protein [Ancylobacter mangrovi]
MRNYLATGLVALSALAAVCGPAGASTLDTVKKNGVVTCAVNGSRPGFSAVDSKGEWHGIDVDTCRALAAAVFGDASKVKFLKTNNQTRLTALQTGEVDVTVANTTWTRARDTDLGLDFVSPTFYDGQGLMVPKALGVKNAQELDGASVCVRPGSTSERVVADIQKKFGIKLKLVVIDDQKEINTAFFGGRCDVAVQSTSGLSSTRAAVAPNPDDYVILPQIFGKDPMGPVVRQDDPQWRDIVQWTVFTLFQAEESGVTSKNVDEMKADSKDATVRRLLGVDDSGGKGLGLDPAWAYNVIKQVGNYGEVFDRNVGKDSPLKLERGINAQYTDGGLIYAPPL